MTVPYLIISDPPHHVDDPTPAVPVFTLSAAEIRMKVNYPVPEIWVVDGDERRIEGALELLKGSGFSVVVAPGSAIADVPDATAVSTFEFGPGGLTLRSGSEEAVLPYDASVVAVFCQPLAPPQLSRPSSSALSARVSHFVDVTESDRRSGDQPAADTAPMAFLDLYTMADGPSRHFRFAQDAVDFAGLRAPSRRASDNLLQLVAEYQGSFPQAILDRRCVAMRVRRNAMVAGQTPSDPIGGVSDPAGRRKGFSFGTTTLLKLLESIAPRLKAMDQLELSSRLVYLTYRQRSATAARA